MSGAKACRERGGKKLTVHVFLHTPLKKKKTKFLSFWAYPGLLDQVSWFKFFFFKTNVKVRRSYFPNFCIIAIVSGQKTCFDVCS